MKWRTRLDTPLARRLGIEAHTAVFRHRDDPGGPRTRLVEQRLFYHLCHGRHPLIAEALQLARVMKARIVVVADSAAQAEAMATHIAITCGQHERTPTKWFTGNGLVVGFGNGSFQSAASAVEDLNALHEFQR
jgi:hypothetical protein